MTTPSITFVANVSPPMTGVVVMTRRGLAPGGVEAGGLGVFVALVAGVATAAAVIAKYPDPPREAWRATRYAIRVIVRQLELRSELEGRLG